MIGLRRGAVKLVPHKLVWKKLFNDEKHLLKKTFGKTVIEIEHIGSSAIPDIPAKPIIDMDIGVRTMKIARGMRKKFEKIGYEHRPFKPGHTKKDLKDQELYVKGPEAKRTHHAHVTVFGSEYWNNDLLFRNYLLKNRGRAKQYAELKKKLAKRYASDRGTYTKNKEKFILETIRMAKKSLNAEK